METREKGYDLVVNVNNFNLSYNDVGEGNIPIIFLHGFPFDKSMWQIQIDFLRATQRLIACDIRGFGNSSDENSALSMDLFAEDLIAFMDKLAIDKAIICGLSMGGFIAFNAQKRFPDRFAAMILCDTQCIADTEGVKENRLKVIDEIALKGAADFNEEFITKVFHKDSLTNKKGLVSKLRSVVFANSQHIICQGLLALAGRSETCSTLHDIQVPTLIICGREDEITPLQESEFMHENIKGSTFRIIEQAGHVSNLEEPWEFNKILLEFLGTLNQELPVNISGYQWSF
ncbi:MAG TPA: alpha/beta hydrolase [Bacteroidetes bacterium]|nr:alpha/beta hydrolase [Bacteroidota bacterium]